MQTATKQAIAEIGTEKIVEAENPQLGTSQTLGWATCIADFSGVLMGRTAPLHGTSGDLLMMMPRTRLERASAFSRQRSRSPIGLPQLVTMRMRSKRGAIARAST